MEKPPTKKNSVHAGEFELIAALKRMIDSVTPGEDVVIGIGDDASVVDIREGQQVMTTDTMVDGVHFRSGQAKWADVGWKSAVSNLSDIAAMGAVPQHALVTLGVPGSIGITDMEALYSGLLDALAQFGGEIVGGDVVSSPAFFVSVTLIGRARDVDGTGLVLRRDAAQPGDLIGVTGTLGGSAGGLRSLAEGRSGVAADELKRLHFRPVPRIEEAGSLLEAGVRCAMDVSDGLLGDLEKICAASEVGAVIDAEEIPVPAELRDEFGSDALAMALTGGEDYELVFTAPFDLMDMLIARHRGRIKHIGRIVSEPEDGQRVVALGANGKPIHFENRGWDHLASS